jgi:hypothetical protein
VNRETRRRTRLLDEIFPDPRIDSAPVTPVARPPRERLTVTALQWELLIHADGQRTPADLAQLLGRAGYATVQELRRLAAAGLLELPEVVKPDNPDFVRLPRSRGTNGGTSVDVHRPVVTAPQDAPTVPIIAGAGAGGGTAPATRAARAVPAAPLAPAAAPPPEGRAEPPAELGGASGDPPRHSIEADPAGTGTSVYRPPRLARRKPGAKLPKDIAADPGPRDGPGTDEVLLKRIRTALRALR